MNQAAKHQQQTFLTVADVAKLLDRHTETIKRWARAGNIPAFKLGGRWAFAHQVIDAWVKAQQEGNGHGDE